MAGDVPAESKGVLYVGEDEVAFALDDVVDWVEGEGFVADEDLVGLDFGVGDLGELEGGSAFGGLEGGLMGGHFDC